MISLLAAAKATLRVIGLATVVQGNPGIDVVMPPVPNATASDVEEHLPVLIVRDSELVKPTDGWTIKPYRPGFSYVILTGEDVQFLPDAENPVAGVPSQLPRLTNGCKWELSAAVAKDVSPAVHAAPMRALGFGMPVNFDFVFYPRPPLVESYRPPLYEAAAAVLRVPYGSTGTCKAVVQKENRERIDTNVQWDTGNGVTIVGKHHETRLRLKGDDVLIVAGNVPKSYLLSGGEHAMKRRRHFDAYYAMLVPGGREGCVRQAPAAGIQRCPGSTSGLQPAPQSDPPEMLHVITSECSNSQYP